jgi:sugar phosphate isomerase/epimerase
MSSAGSMNRKVGKPERFDKEGWADFKRKANEYARAKAIKDANEHPSRLTITRINKTT